METQFITNLSNYQTAKLLEIEQDYNLAERYYLDSIQRSERPSEAFFALARVYMRKGSYDTAIGCFEKSITAKTISLVGQLAQKHGFPTRSNIESQATLWLWFSLLLLDEREMKLSVLAMHESNKATLFETRI